MRFSQMKANLILIQVWYKRWIDYVIFWHARKLMTVYPVLLQNNCRIFKYTSLPSHRFSEKLTK